MEFHERLQALRKQKGLTQEQLACALHVSRTAVSRWESGRGYPNLDSLQDMAAFFCLTVDQLLSGEAAQTAPYPRALPWLDLGAVAFAILPLFARRTGGAVQAVWLWALRDGAVYLRGAFWLVVCATVAWGLLSVTGRGGEGRRYCAVSLLLSGMAALVFAVTAQPYAAALGLAFLALKLYLLGKTP